MTLPSNLDRYAGRLAFAVCAAVAVLSAIGGHHLGVSHGIGEAASIQDENRVMHSVCYDVLELAERTATASVAAQETFRAVYAARMEAMTTTTTTEVDR